MTIDRQRVRNDLAARALFVKELKRAQRESGQPSWSGEKARLLIGWQVQVTLLCMVLAHSRGRMHLRKWGPERYENLADQEKVVLALREKYVVPAAA